jgi:hypothetical protein
MEEGAGNYGPLLLSPLQLHCNHKKITLGINFIDIRCVTTFTTLIDSSLQAARTFTEVCRFSDSLNASFSRSAEDRSSLGTPAGSSKWSIEVLSS